MHYGQNDTTFIAAGKEKGISSLVNDFYTLMATNSDYQSIQTMHKSDTETSKDKLATFLCGWMGGPRNYAKTYGSINIPSSHKHLKITSLEKDLWLQCMAQALDMQAYPQALKTYLIEQLSIPAERIRQASEHYSKDL